ncbi:surface protease GP63, partial [Trypanosoma rangeli]
MISCYRQLHGIHFHQNISLCFYFLTLHTKHLLLYKYIYSTLTNTHTRFSSHAPATLSCTVSPTGAAPAVVGDALRRWVPRKGQGAMRAYTAAT